MTAPARREAARLLLSLDPPAWFLAHACAVADVAAWLARRAEAQGHEVDLAAVEAAALLHDVDKLPAVGRQPEVRHGDGSAAWLTARGLPALGELVRDHPVTRLVSPDDAARLAGAPLEARIVAYADKRAGQHLETMDARFASWRRRYPAGTALAPKPGSRKAAWTDAEIALVVDRAETLEREICAAAAASPTTVQRLRWARRAIGAAQ